MLKAWKEKRARLKLQADCNHRWELFAIVPPAERKEDELPDFYKTRCLKCGYATRRTYLGLKRLERLGRLQTMKGEGIL